MKEKVELVMNEMVRADKGSSGNGGDKQIWIDVDQEPRCPEATSERADAWPGW